MTLLARWSPLALVFVLVACGDDEKNATVTVTKTETVTVQASATAPPEQPADEASDATIGKEQEYENIGEIEINGEPVSSTLKVRVSSLKANIANPQ